MRSRSRFAWSLAVMLAAAPMLAPGASAQGSGDGFLFKAPAVSLSLRGGLGHASAGSDIFSFSTEHLTLGRDDFSGPTFGGDLAIRLAPRFDLVLGGAYAGRTASSEFRDWVDNDDLPIEQTTEYQRVPLTASVKAYLLPRGRSIGRFAWLPARFAPYVGVGGGMMWYRFAQEGDFVDFQTLEVFYERLESSGWTSTAQALAGVDYSLSPRFALTGEARYLWSQAELSNSFQEFEPIDLSGLSATLGISVRF